MDIMLKPANLGIPFGPIYSLVQLLRGLRHAFVTTVCRFIGTHLTGSVSTASQPSLVTESAVSNTSADYRSSLRRILARVSNVFRKRPVQVALSQTLMPFNEIVKQNQWWVNLALRRTGRCATIAACPSQQPQ